MKSSFCLARVLLLVSSTREGDGVQLKLHNISLHNPLGPAYREDAERAKGFSQ